MQLEAIKMGVVLIKWVWPRIFHESYNPTILKILDPPLLSCYRAYVSPAINWVQINVSVCVSFGYILNISVCVQHYVSSVFTPTSNQCKLYRACRLLVNGIGIRLGL